MNFKYEIFLTPYSSRPTPGKIVFFICTVVILAVYGVPSADFLFYKYQRINNIDKKCLHLGAINYG